MSFDVEKRADGSWSIEIDGLHLVLLVLTCIGILAAIGYGVWGGG